VRGGKAILGGYAATAFLLNVSEMLGMEISLFWSIYWLRAEVVLPSLPRRYEYILSVSYLLLPIKAFILYRLTNINEIRTS
jgi:hypothetical protein